MADGRPRKKPAVKPAAKPPAKQARERPLGWKGIYLCAAVLAVVGVVGYQLYWPRKSLAPKLPPITGVEINRDAWGTHRSHMYFGLQQKKPKAPLFGMMWYEQPDQTVMPKMRHWCDQGDGVSRYAWVQADGRTFGRQNITDGALQMRVDWLNHEDTWTARVMLNPLKTRRFNVIFYLVSQGDYRFSAGDGMDPIFYSTDGLADGMKMSVKRIDGGGKVMESSILWDDHFNINQLNDLVLMNTRILEIDGKLVFQLNHDKPYEQGAFAAVQFYTAEKATFEVSLSSKTHEAIKGKAFSKELSARSAAFDTKFQNTFHVKGKKKRRYARGASGKRGAARKGYSQVALDMGKVALSNMLGSVGYWYGSNKVHVREGETQRYGPHEMISAVPSRPFFPRAFLWDEGFHNLLINKFDPDLSVQILTTWLNTMNEDGWIPREMILGKEAEAKVPAEFVVQHRTNANPPSMFILAEKLINNPDVVEKYGHVLPQIYTKLERWYNWLLHSQRGKVAGSMRWRGRNATTDLELNPKTLASGLDDYPRASHPSEDERHLDLRCWMAICSRVMARLSELYGQEADKKKYAEHAKQFSDYQQLLKLHWSEKTKSFHDFGKHSFSVKLVKEMDRTTPGEYVLKRKVMQEPRLQLVEDVFGYNSLFPLIFRLIPTDAPELEHVLRRLKDPEELWTEFGLRSISKSSPYYAAYNTEHDPPYWRGYIWINLNYLVLSSLKHYASVEGPYQKLSASLMHDLRLNIVRNMAIQFNRTGYLWENYSDRNGEGRGCRPFTGWSSLVLLIMDDDLDV